MASLCVKTNISRSFLDLDQMSDELAIAVASAFKIPVDRCMVTIIPDTQIRMGIGSAASKPVASVSLMPTDTFFMSSTFDHKVRKNVLALLPILKKHLGVDSRHVYLSAFGRGVKVLFEFATFENLIA